MKYAPVLLLCMILFCSCAGNNEPGENESDVITLPCQYARYFEISDGAVITVSPYGGKRDTVLLRRPAGRVVCLSSTHVACLSAIGADSVICGVSGISYLANESLRSRHSVTSDKGSDILSDDVRLPLYDIGYDNFLDFEKILQLKPDLVTAYSVSGAEPQHLKKLRELGLPVIVLHDHLEEHPLARAEYVRLFGVLTGRESVADSVFRSVHDRYISLISPVSGRCVKVLMNIPYADAWYIPGSRNYMARLITDAGGEVLGAVESEKSGVISLEQAYVLSGSADLWLNPGFCRSRAELSSIHQLFPFFGPLAKGLPIYNNIRRMTSGGGNDFWESGAVRPDLVLEDLVHIMQGETDHELHYFVRLD